MNDPALLKIAETLHIIFCREPHANDMLTLALGTAQNECCWYLEVSMANTWNYASHEKWLKEASNFCVALGLPPADSLRILYKLIDFVKLGQTLPTAALSLALDMLSPKDPEAPDSS